MTASVLALALALAAFAPALGYGWLGHGAYKLVLLATPFSGARRPWLAGALTARIVFLSCGLGALFGGAGFVLAQLAAHATWQPAAMRAALDARFAYTPATVTVAAFLIATANAGLEEWFYRAWLDLRVGAAASAAVFGIQHVIVLTPLAGPAAAVIAGVLLVPVALAWSFLARRDGWALSTLSHVVADLVLFSGGLVLLGYWS